MSSKKVISLSVRERIYALGLFNQFKGGMNVLKKILDDSVVVEIGTEEGKEIELKLSEKNITWNNEKAKNKELELHEESVEYLVGKINEKDKAGELTLGDSVVLELKEKLEAK
jgi:hypothetical protein